MFKGQITYSELLNMSWRRVFTLRDIRIERLEEQRKEFEKAEQAREREYNSRESERIRNQIQRR